MLMSSLLQKEYQSLGVQRGPLQRGMNELLVRANKSDCPGLSPPTRKCFLAWLLDAFCAWDWSPKQADQSPECPQDAEGGQPGQPGQPVQPGQWTSRAECVLLWKQMGAQQAELDNVDGVQTTLNICCLLLLGWFILHFFWMLLLLGHWTHTLPEVLAKVTKKRQARPVAARSKRTRGACLEVHSGVPEDVQIV